MGTRHTLIINDCTRVLPTLPTESIHLIVTSPPYFNSPFDYPGLYESYSEYLRLLANVARESFRLLADGRCFVLNIDDMLVEGERYPILADATRIFMDVGFRYRDRITWKKPDGYAVRGHRSGNLMKYPYPFYFYPDNVSESILVFEKGRFNFKSVDNEVREASRIDLDEVKRGKLYLNMWEMTNVLPSAKLEKGIAAFPDELPYRAITVYSFKGEIVLDMFAGSGTTSKVARQLGRNSIAIEINPSLEAVFRTKTGFDKAKTGLDTLEVIHPKITPSIEMATKAS